VFDPRPDAPESIVSHSPETPFGAHRVKVKNEVFNTRIPPEPETRNGLSLARNDAFATITRSMLPTCAFASTPVFPCEPVRPQAPPLGSVSKPIPGEFFTFDPLSAPISGAPAMPSGLHSPSGFSTLRIEAFNRLHRNKLASPDARLFFAPRSALFRFSLRINARNPSSSCLANRSVNPGTESIIYRKRSFVK